VTTRASIARFRRTLSKINRLRPAAVHVLSPRDGESAQDWQARRAEVEATIEVAHREGRGAFLIIVDMDEGAST
jgi:hypothetical protein